METDGPGGPTNERHTAMRLITFAVPVDDDAYDYDDVRRLVGDGTADVYADRPYDDRPSPEDI